MSQLPHDSAHTHVTGKSEFVDDRPRVQNELYVDVVYSPHAKAKIKKISFEKALQLAGVAGIFFAKDFHSNVWGTIFKDQPLLADKEVQFAGEVIILIAADNPNITAAAKKLIEIQYEVLTPILTVEDAISQQSFIAGPRKIERGQIAEALKSAPHKIKNTLTL